MNNCPDCDVSVGERHMPDCAQLKRQLGAAYPRAASPLDTQVGGDHYKKLGDYQPWEVLRRWLTTEEFRGYMKGTAIAYLAREKDKGGTQDIEKAMHTLAGFVDLEAKP